MTPARGSRVRIKQSGATGYVDDVSMVDVVVSLDVPGRFGRLVSVAHDAIEVVDGRATPRPSGSPLDLSDLPPGSAPEGT